jgi:hypothetical protein
MIQTVYEDGYSWVEIDDAAWARSTQMDYFDGIPIPFNNNQHKFI